MLQGNKKDIEKLLPYVGERLQKALAYVAATDFSKVENGEYEIDGRNVFARVNTYDTEPKAERRPEKHNVNREGYLNQSQIARKARNHAGCGLFLYLRYFQKVSTAHRK